MSSLIERIESAITRITNGQGGMRVPADETDPDLVLADCKTEIARLRAEVEGSDRLHQVLEDKCEALESAVAKARAEADALGVDAERYRWLRDKAPDEWSVLLWVERDVQLLIDDSLMDDKIDAAMGADA